MAMLIELKLQDLIGGAINRSRGCLLACMGVFLASCSTTPSTNIHQPMTARPVSKIVVAPADGAIYHAGINERPLFEDRRARNVGDLLVISVVETTTGNRSATGASSSSSSMADSTPSVAVGALAKVLLKPISVTGSNSNKSANAGSGSASETLTATLSVTVIEVLANGNLLVSGEKQVSLNNSDQYIRFSGVVNPTSISNLNVVLSNQVADAHFEFKNSGAMGEVMNDAKALGFLGRFFMSVLPF